MGQNVLDDHKAPLRQTCRAQPWRVFSAFALLLPLAAPAVAQSLPSPGALQVSPIPRLEPPVMPRVAPGLQGLPTGSLTNTAPEQPIAVRGVTVEGVTVYPSAETDALVAGLVGPAVPLRQIEDSRLALVRKYRDGGYPLVSVQATRSPDGTLHFVVFEGRIAEVKLDGDIGPAGTQVLRFLNRLTESRPIDAASLERWLLLAQDVPGVALQAVLQPSDSEPGALTLVATVKRTSISGIITGDNRAYKLTGPVEALATIDFNSFTSLGERTEVNLFYGFNNTQIFGQASTEMFLGASGLRLRVYAGAGNTTPSGFLRTLDYNGDTTVAGAQLTYPLIRARQQTLNLVGNFDILDSDITSLPGGVAFSTDTNTTPASKYSLRVLRAGVDYALQDLWAGNARPAVNGVTVRVSQGLDGLGASASAVNPARVGEQLNFTKVTAQLTRDQTLFTPWTGASVSLFGLATGQGSGSVIPPAEEFFLGGNRYTRGFYVGEVSGDSGLALTGELRLTTSTDMTAFGRQIDIGTRSYLFYDWGEVWQNQKTQPNNVLRSMGLGARISLTRYFELDVEGVRRFTTHPDGLNVGGLQADAFYAGALVRF